MGSGSRDIRSEFARAAPYFIERSKGRFDALDAVAFARAEPGDVMLEVGAGTGNFLALFEGHVERRIAADLTFEMLRQAASHGGIESVCADGARLPFRSRSFDLVASAQALHHVHEPVPFVREMRRVTRDGGRVLIVDQHSTESYEQTIFMNQLEVLRDPTHAMSRPPSAFRVICEAAGLRVVETRLWEGRNRLSEWMWPGEFPSERIAAVRDFIESLGHETGMGFQRDGDDWVFTRRRIMLLAER